MPSSEQVIAEQAANSGICSVGLDVGTSEGVNEGDTVGRCVGTGVGAFEGALVGMLGAADGTGEGSVGDVVGESEGLSVGGGVCFNIVQQCCAPQDGDYGVALAEIMFAMRPQTKFHASLKLPGPCENSVGDAPTNKTPCIS